MQQAEPLQGRAGTRSHHQYACALRYSFQVAQPCITKAATKYQPRQPVIKWRYYIIAAFQGLIY